MTETQPRGHIIGRTAAWLRERPALARFALQCVPDVPFKITIDPIGPFYIRLRRHRSFWLRDPLTHERVVFGALQRLVRPGDVVYDVGANVGLYARFLVQAFGASKVFAFEPMRTNIELLEKNIALEPAAAGRVSVITFALGDSDGEELLQVDDVMSASASLDKVRQGRPAEGREMLGLPPVTEKVVVKRLDTVLEQQSLAPPNLIKVDIEGAELMFLHGAARTLAKHKPRLIMEMHATPTTRSVLEILERHGYATYGFVKNGDRKVWRAVRASDVRDDADVYDLHHVFAAPDADVLRQAPEPYRR